MVNIKDTNLKFNGKLTALDKSKLKYIVHHHMAHDTWDINDVHNYHKNGNGWSGIGYNYWIGFDGTIYKGRGLNVGAHCLNYNSVSVGIGYQGNFKKQKMTDAQVKAGAELVKYINKQVGKTLKNVGHKDLGNTACPGKNFRMSELKKLVEAKETSSNTSKKVNTAYSGYSIVDYLVSIGQSATFANRSKLAKKYGIKNYKGTASQNLELLDKLRGNTTKNQTKTVKQMADEVIAGEHGNGHDNRRKSLGISKTEYEKVRKEVNKRMK